jgi:hypothetical protein
LSAITVLGSPSPLTANIEAPANSSSTGMDEDHVDALDSELAMLRQMVDTQTTTLSTIQQQLSLLVNLTVHNPPQPTTATPSQTVDPPLEQPLLPRPAAQPTQGGTSLKPAAPSEFDGSRHKGRAFLNSCELYMNLALQQFTNKTSRYIGHCHT